MSQLDPVHTPHSTSWRSILILSSHLCLGLPIGHFPSGFPTKARCTPHFSPICPTCPTHLILVNFMTRTILSEEYRSLSSSLCSFLHSLVTSSLSGPNIILYTLFSNTPSLHSSLNVSDRVSHLYKTGKKSIVLHILISKFQDGKRRQKILHWTRSIPWLHSALNFLMNTILGRNSEQHKLKNKILWNWDYLLIQEPITFVRWKSPSLPYKIHILLRMELLKRSLERVWKSEWVSEWVSE